MVVRRDGKLLMEAKLSEYKKTSELKPELFKVK